MSGKVAVGETFGQRRPPLSVTIRQILDRYPEGQIFKEMIQNADDAGATVIQFYVDCRQHGTRNLVHPELAAYQGPALISANDAMFSEQDWEGIQSLQQSVKAEDPFKVGRFGIGFNSVYHLTDLPMVISGDHVVFLEPQEQIWRGESGRQFCLGDLSSSDHLTAADGIAGFSKSQRYYRKTLFRFPLRKTASGLSEKVFDVDDVNELVKTLRSEAKLLLLFLRSIHTIEVYNIDRRGQKIISFRSKVEDAFIQEFTQKRSAFLAELKSCYASEGYAFAKIIPFTCQFSVSVYDSSRRDRNYSTSRWMVASRVDSTNAAVREASVKLSVFPWVGTAVDLDNPGNGRIFCFLPLPVESTANFPIHVNGMFSLKDDRRSLKWPGVERRNDLSAYWNQILVRDVLPSCYAELLLHSKLSFDYEKFYQAWPDVKTFSRTQWEAILNPVFAELWKEDVILSRSGWVLPSQAVCIPGTNKPSEVVCSALMSCNVKLADVPESVWKAYAYTKVAVSEVSPHFVRDKLRGSPKSYAQFKPSDKLELLKYCMSDEQFNGQQLDKLHLLPLANKSFAAFQFNRTSSLVYISTEDCPRRLLPNLDHRLVDLSDDNHLQTKLMDIATSHTTQLRVLDVSAVADLLDEAMPSSWKEATLVTLPDKEFQRDWFSMFWNWVRKYKQSLNLFHDKLILPIECAGLPAATKFYVVRLQRNQPLLYFPYYLDCGKTVQSILNKLGIWYCSQESFPFVEHEQLSNFIKTYSTETLLGAIKVKGLAYASVKLSTEEAEFLRWSLSSMAVSSSSKSVLHELKIFLSCSNSSSDLYSINDVLQLSLQKKVVIEPQETIELSALPSQMIIFASQEGSQRQLLKQLGYFMPNEIDFLTQHIIPKVLAMGNPYTDKVMMKILYRCKKLRYPSNLTSAISQLPFIKVTSGARNCPSKLLDPNDKLLSEIFKGKDLFPSVPYDDTKVINILKNCGLRTSVTPQEILDVIYSISSAASPKPVLVKKAKLRCAAAILEYMASSNFPSHVSSTCKVDPKIHQGPVSFQTALSLLSIHRSWLPVLAEKPSNYPSCLPWKGAGFTSHCISLKGSVCVTDSSSPSLPFVYGSHAYFTPACDHLKAGPPIHSLVPHFKNVIAVKDQLTADQLIDIVHCIYSAMMSVLQKGGQNLDALDNLKSLTEWVYIKKHHRFVSVHNVALSLNPSFTHYMEPYLYILPDSLSAYSQLFRHFGMKETITRSQIVSMLGLIKEEIHSKHCSVTPETAWSTVMVVLNWLTKNGTEKIDSETLASATVYVPVDSSSKWPDLRDPRNLVYADNDFLKNFLSSSSVSPSTNTFVHSHINRSLANCLNITPLSEELDISEDTFDDAGQYEPLTTRLKNILKDYKDGLTIVKELIQNADDAEATEVNICFDARTHTKDRSRLFFPDMCEAHGPALVIHNNKTFSDEDFENIQKLAAATKQEKHLKIGKFGIGFCSVYHITDVPSFVSRDRFYIFDPTLQYLKYAVRDLSRPGKKVRYQDKNIACSRQMEPYEGLFGFRHDAEYQGTMFRLPFRTSSSELSGTIYSESSMRDLIESIQKCGDKLLLFLQHIKRITIQRFDSGKASPEVVHVLERVPSPQTLSPAPASVVTVKSKYVRKNNSITKNWLVASYEASSREKYAVASIACLLNQSGDSYSVCDTLSGEVFCYLPLSQTSGLPVHVSCNFAVVNNRRGIWTSDQADLLISSNESLASVDSCGDEFYETQDDSSDDETKWNVMLMEEVIPEAYIMLLQGLKSLFNSGQLQKYEFYSLWPVNFKLQQKNPWEKFVSSFYKLLLSQQKLFYAESISKWLTFDESKFLEDDIFGHGEPLTCVLDVLHHLKTPLVNLPSSYLEHLNPRINELITEMGFILVFFDNLAKLSTVKLSRNEVVYHLLRTYASRINMYSSDLCDFLESKLEICACIPTSPDGTVMRKCSEIVEPNQSFSQLFDDGDHRFPLKMLTDDLALAALKRNGIISDSLPDDLILDRAQSIQPLMETHQLKALVRVKAILKILSNKKFVSKVHSIPFLPVMKKPKDYPLYWYGNQYQLLQGKQLMLSSPIHASKNQNLYLAGSQVAFVCEDTPDNGGCGKISSTQAQLLRIRSSPSLVEVISHLQVPVSEANSDNPPSCEWVGQSCSAIYDFVDKLCHKEESELNLSQLKTFPCIWNGTTFLEVDSLAMNWKMKDGPYLYATPPEVAAKKALVKSLDIKENFEFDDAVQALQSMKSDFGEAPICQACKDLVIEISLIFNKVATENLGQKAVYLPDSNNILRSSADLVYNDAPWVPLDEGLIEVSSVFPRKLAESLGVQLKRSKLLGLYVSKKKSHFGGVPFGQREELTRRIQNIIRDYPFDITIFKELLQNADDAKAKKMYIILDKRTHGKQSVISQEWQELQGPALLVWNDSNFTESDLKGIQELGLGSKRSDTESIGQFGIGFNVVYHLTDCPSFITGGDTLCVFDPHCRYVPEAEVTLPGGRYDNLSGGFWKEFKDMGSAYLQTGTENLPEELRGGSLFRFPIRHTHKMVRTSKIICQEDESFLPDFPTSEIPVHDSESASDHERSDSEFLKPMRADTLSSLMNEWMPSMKQAMFFLNNVTEIKYFEIDSEKSSLHKLFHFKTAITQSQGYLDDRQRLRSHVSKFTKSSGCESCVILYPLILTDVDCTGREKDKNEKWLIQQGIGDVSNEEQYWQYVKSVKPKHGIAAPLKMPPFESESGQLFCFLPLPAKSDVPVHVNGNFALNSTRKGLWVSSDPEVPDGKSRWNEHLLKAIASSYAHFLVQAREQYIERSYSNWTDALEALSNYYKLFPVFTTADVNRLWNSLSCNVYKAMIKSNAEVACVFVTQNRTNPPIISEWCNIISQDPAQQVYLWAETKDRKIVHPILQSMGLKITSAPHHVMQCFNDTLKEQDKLQKYSGRITIGDEASTDASISEPSMEYPIRRIPSIRPETVFNYYTEHSTLSSRSGSECHISESIFNDIETFLIFIKYLVGIDLEPSKSNLDHPGATDYTTNSSDMVSPANALPNKSLAIRSHSFPGSPFSHFLLLTADNKLRRFENTSKVFSSKFSHLYPRHLDRFLHPALQEIKFDKSYFIQPDDEEKKVLPVILSTFEGTFPQILHKQSIVSNASDNISQRDLQMFWECFGKDPVFSKHVSKFLKHWALLLTTDNRLFSTLEQVKPSYFPVLPECWKEESGAATNLFESTSTPSSQKLVVEEVDKVCAIMKSLQMPFLNESVVTIKVPDCPTLTDRNCILNNFYHMNEGASLTQFLGNEDINVLIRYFAKDTKPGDSKWLKQIQSLPLFNDVVDQFQPVFNSKAYVWPNCCIAGYSKWVQGTGTIFLQRHALWTMLGSAKQLNILDISDVSVYTNYIFPRFQLLTESERYEHLNHIRQYIYFTAISYSQREVTHDTIKEDSQKISDSTHFIEALRSVRCIGPSDDLKPISSFIDCRIKLFHFFPEDFSILPKQLQSEDCHNFLKELGLKFMLEQHEYLNLCMKVADDNVDNVEQCSAVLLDYLFSLDEELQTRWWQQEFLQAVSNIPFVPAADISSVSWLVPGVCQKHEMVKLNGAASESLSNLLWTVKPIIQLPDKCLRRIQAGDKNITKMLEIMCVAFRANAEDVIANIEHISVKSKHSDDSLFDYYPEELIPPDTAQSLLDIMVANLKHLNEESTFGPFYSLLSAVPCIPVPIITDDRSKTIALVMPSCVLADRAVASQYYPYLHALPTQLEACLVMLQKVNVKLSLELTHVQIVLQKLYNGRHPMNAKKIMKRALKSLFLLLKAANDDQTDILASLSPLYLPDTTNELKLSTEMVYQDCATFFDNIEIDLTGTKLSHFAITKQNYGINAINLCRLLPEQVSPLKLSDICDQSLAEECSVSADHSDTSHRIEATVIFPSNATVIATLFDKFSPYDCTENELENFLQAFFTSIKVFAVQDLRTQIVYRKEQRVIGQRKSDCFIKTSTSQRLLYIDYNFDDEDEVIDEIVQSLHAAISYKFFPTGGLPWEDNADLFKTIKKYFKADTPTKKNKVLNRLGVEVEHLVKLKLGDEIPIEHQARLDHNPYNIFTPMEYVGYEDREGHLIVAQVLKPVEISIEAHSLHRMYIIFSSPSKAIREEASAIDLYKFKSSTRPDKQDAAILAAVEESPTLLKSQKQLDKSEKNKKEIDRVKEKIQKEFSDILLINPEKRTKAMKRIYLKWYTDEIVNCLEEASEIFTYLKREIVKKLEQFAKADSASYDAIQFEELESIGKMHCHRKRVLQLSHVTSLMDQTSWRKDTKELIYDESTNVTAPKDSNSTTTTIGHVKHTPSVHIKGISAVTNIEVYLTNEEQIFELKGYGLKLTVPPNSLPSNVDSCIITIQASLSGNYQFPTNTELVSPVFWLKCQPVCKFVTPLGLEISHCAPLENSSCLSMVRAFCTQRELPYNFKLLPGGMFSPKYTYGFISLEEFSGWAVVQNGSNDRRYWSSVFYMGPAKRRKVHFAITWDDDAHITTIKNEYAAKSAQNGPEQSLAFRRDVITLDIPREGHVKDDWKVTPTVPPKILKKDVDSYHLESKSKAVPHCEMVARWLKGEQEIMALEYLVDILGATGHRFFTIIIDSSDDQQDAITHSSLRLPAETTTVITSQDVSYLIGHLCNHASRWKDIGTSLTFLPGELENIIHAHPNASPQQLLAELLYQWSQWPTADHSNHPTLERLCEALQSSLVRLGAVASNLYGQRNSLPSFKPCHS